MEAPYYPFLCSRCHQFTVPGQDLKQHPADAPLVCDTCRAVEREPQGEAVQLFTPAPAVMRGQEGMFQC